MEGKLPSFNKWTQDLATQTNHLCCSSVPENSLFGSRLCVLNFSAFKMVVKPSMSALLWGKRTFIIFVSVKKGRKHHPLTRVTYMSTAEAFVTTIKFFDWQKVCMLDRSLLRLLIA